MSEDTWTDVNFASDEAAERAMRAGLEPGDFGSRTPSGKGGFTVKDVQAVIADRKPKPDPAPDEAPYREETWHADVPLYVSTDPPFSHTDEQVVRRRLGLD